MTTSWITLLRRAAIALAIASVLIMASGRFVGPSLVVLLLGLGGGVAALGRKPRLGAGLLLFFALANFLLHGGLIVFTLRTTDGGVLVALQILGVVAGLGVIVAAVPVLRRRTGDRAPALLSRGAIAVVLVAVVASAAGYLTRPQEEPAADDLRVTTSGLAVDVDQLEAPAGMITIAIRNDDPLFVRSFDINDLDVHVTIPPRTWRRVSFEATAGSYEFHDEITFTADTEGILVVD